MLKSTVILLFAVTAPLFTNAAPAESQAGVSLEPAAFANATLDANAMRPYVWLMSFYTKLECGSEPDNRAGFEGICYDLPGKWKSFSIPGLSPGCESESRVI